MVVVGGGGGFEGVVVDDDDVVVEVERREEKRRAGLEEFEGLVLLVEGDAAVAFALVTDGAEGWAGVMVARRMGAGILTVFGCFLVFCFSGVELD